MIDFQGLLNVVKAAEAEPNLHMEFWANPLASCGTTHCMIGAFCVQNPKDVLRLRGTNVYLAGRNPEWDTYSHVEAVAVRFNISDKEAEWLFTVSWGLWSRCKSAAQLTKEEAISRLRKFIYYKMHKNEMTYEEARNVDGNKAVVVAKERLLCLQA